jgi:hypothetical protein
MHRWLLAFIRGRSCNQATRKEDGVESFGSMIYMCLVWLSQVGVCVECCLAMNKSDLTKACHDLKDCMAPLSGNTKHKVGALSRMERQQSIDIYDDFMTRHACRCLDESHIQRWKSTAEGQTRGRTRSWESQTKVGISFLVHLLSTTRPNQNWSHKRGQEQRAIMRVWGRQGGLGTDRNCQAW